MKYKVNDKTRVTWSVQYVSNIVKRLALKILALKILALKTRPST
jgi:hypothetical protein